MTVDGNAITPINGPYGELYYSCIIGNWAAGAHAYAIIQQDMVDAILSDRTEDRRFLFEEAAGIGVYRNKREDALRKLELLVVIDIQMSETAELAQSDERGYAVEEASGAGGEGRIQPLGQLAACFVLPIADDMGRDSAGIFQTLRDAALIQQTGGGNGFGFSRLRPKASLVKSSAGEATGPVGFLRVYDKAFGEIAQGGCLLPETLVFTDRGLLRRVQVDRGQVQEGDGVRAAGDGREIHRDPPAGHVLLREDAGGG